MSTEVQPDAFSVQASDVSGQKTVKVAGVAPQATVGELVKGLVPKMDLPSSDADGRPLSYQVRLEREGRHLHMSEFVGEVLEPGDQIVLQPNIMAGSR